MPTFHHLDAGTLRPAGGADLVGAAELPSHVLVVEHDDGHLTLVDAGIGLADMAAPDARLGADFCALSSPVLEPDRAVVRQLVALGLDPARVTDVLLTHPDLDHAGGLADLPHARVHAHPDAVAAVADPRTERDRERVHPAQWSHAVRWAPPPAPGEPWHGLTAWTPDGFAPDEVVMVDLPGHATGHVGYAVRGSAGWVLHAGDAFFHRSSLSGEAVPPGLDAFETMVEEDREARLATVAALAALPPEVTVVCSHDPEMLAAAHRMPTSRVDG